MTGEQWKLVEYALWGGLAALIGAMAKSRRLTLPQIFVVRRDGKVKRRVIDMGFLVAPLMGGLLAAVVDGRPSTAVAYGLAAGYAGPALVNAIVDGVLNGLGYAVKTMRSRRGDGETGEKSDGPRLAGAD
jgi:hypothetical protein